MIGYVHSSLPSDTTGLTGFFFTTGRGGTARVCCFPPAIAAFSPLFIELFPLSPVGGRSYNNRRLFRHICFLRFSNLTISSIFEKSTSTGGGIICAFSSSSRLFIMARENSIADIPMQRKNTKPWKKRICFPAYHNHINNPPLSTL